MFINCLLNIWSFASGIFHMDLPTKVGCYFLIWSLIVVKNETLVKLID